MIYYTKDELQSSTVVSRNFGAVLDSLNTKKLEKVAVMRNNKMEAIIIPADEYEKLMSLREFIEQYDIFNLINEREKSIENNSISLNEVLSEYGLSKDDFYRKRKR